MSYTKYAISILYSSNTFETCYLGEISIIGQELIIEENYSDLKTIIDISNPNIDPIKIITEAIITIAHRRNLTP